MFFAAVHPTGPGPHAEPPLSHDDPGSLAPPDVIGPYRVLHQIGSGVLGPVFRVLDPDTDTIVAVKQFKLDWPPEQAHALAGALGTLIETLPPHPSIVAPLSAGQDHGGAWLALELVAADGLDARMRRRTAVTADALVAVLRQVAAALDAGADAGWRHGALHPRDVLVDTTGRVRVTGIGIAQVVERFGAKPPRRRPYSAPERAAGAHWDRRADVFALATIAAEWIGARRGRGGADDLHAALDRAGLEPEPAARLLDAAVAASPDDRPDRATAFVDALAATVTTARPFPADTAPGLPFVSPTVAAGVPTDPASLVADEAPSDDDTLVVPAFPSEAESAAASEIRHAADPLREVSRVADEVSPAVAGAAEPQEWDDAWPRSAGVEEDRLVAEEVEGEEEEIEEELDLPLALPAEPAPVSSDIAPPAPRDAQEFVPRWDEEPEAPAPTPPAAGGPPALDDERAAWRWTAALAAALVLGIAIGFWAGRWSATPARARVETPAATAAASPAAATEIADEPAVSEPPDIVSPTPVPAASARAPQPEVSTPAPVERRVSGRLLVRTSPTGARVRIDGRDRGTSPATIRDLPPGRYALEIVREGYERVTRQVQITERRPSVTLDVPLRRDAPARAAASEPASLEFVTRPAGAQVFLDNRPVGVSPRTVTDVPPGSRTVRFELPGHAPWTKTVSVKPGESLRVTGSLEPLR